MTYDDLRYKLNNILTDNSKHQHERMQHGEYDMDFQQYRVDEIIRIFKRNEAVSNYVALRDAGLLEDYRCVDCKYWDGERFHEYATCSWQRRRVARLYYCKNLTINATTSNTQNTDSANQK